MKRLSAIALLLVLSAAATAEDVVSEAKASLATKHHKAMVEKAEKLLEQKKELEAKLADVDEKLGKLANGQDVKIKEEENNYVIGNVCCYATGQAHQ